MEKTWAGIHNLIGTKGRISAEKSLVVNGETIAGRSDVAEAFNHFFTTVAHNLARGIPESNHCPISFLHESTRNQSSIFYAELRRLKP